MYRTTASARPFAALALAVVLTPATSFAHGDLHERIQALTAEIAKSPDSARLYLDRGELHRLHGEWAEAERDLAKAEELDPKLAAVWLCRARLLLGLKKFPEADKEVGRFLATAATNRMGLTVKAQALAGQRKFREAADVWKAIIDSSQNTDVEPYYERAHVLAAAGPKYREEALQVLDEGLERLGKVPTLGLYAIELEVELRRFSAALERVEKLMPKTGRKDTWLELRGDILAKAGKRQEAHAAYQDALTAMEAAPARVRTTKAGVELQERLRKKLEETRPTGSAK